MLKEGSEIWALVRQTVAQLPDRSSSQSRQTKDEVYVVASVVAGGKEYRSAAPATNHSRFAGVAAVILTAVAIRR